MNFPVLENYVDIESIQQFSIKEIDDKFLDPVFFKEYLTDRELLKSLIKNGYANNFITRKIDEYTISNLKNNDYIHVEEYDRDKSIKNEGFTTIKANINTNYDFFNDKSDVVAIFRVKRNNVELIIGRKKQ